MDILSPLILLQENGYKALGLAKGDDDLRLVVVELEAKMACVADGDLDVTVGFANRGGKIGVLGRIFNSMVHQLSERREESERLHRAQILRAECLATSGELATGLAHEIRNMLAGIAGVIEIVDRDLPVNSPPRASVKLLGAEITQVNRILTDLLHAARPHLPEIRSSDLNATVERAVLLVRQQSLSTPIRIELHKDLSLPSVEHDSGQICQLVLNLLLNAVQAIDGAGAIRVDVSLIEGDATITVVDTGRGIAPEHLANIFRPFYTTKGSGTGLGLSLARRTAEEHHGRIEVNSAGGKGATFAVTLPLLQPKARGAAS
jgi:signal transduction histidine kinase